MLFMERNGFPEEVYFTFSYSPVADEVGRHRRDVLRLHRDDGTGTWASGGCARFATSPRAPAEARTVADACDCRRRPLERQLAPMFRLPSSICR